MSAAADPAPAKGSAWQASAGRALNLLRRHTTAALLVLLVCFVGGIEMIVPGTVTPTWISNIVLFAAPLGILAAGQTMLVNGTAGASKLGLLESSSNGSSSGSVTITYTDGTSTTETLSSSDWANGPGTTETAVATMTYRNMGSGGSQTITMYVYATTVPIDTSKTVASVTFPDVSNSVGSSTTAMHIFAVTTG